MILKTGSRLLKLACTILLIFFSIQRNALAQASASEKKEEKKYKGSVDLGLTFANGNNKEESIVASLELDYKFNEQISNILKSRADNKKVNRVRVRERYFLNNQTRRDIDKLNFKFLELEYIGDRYGGYDYRTSETIGLGRRLIDRKDGKLTVQASAGMRQIKLTTSEKRNNPLVRGATNFEININETLLFSENFDVSYDQIAAIIRSETNLKISLSKKLYLKFSVLAQRVTNVPVDTKNSDVTTSLNLGYKF